MIDFRYSNKYIRNFPAGNDYEDYTTWYIKHGWLVFHVISMFVDYLIPNPVQIYKYMLCNIGGLSTLAKELTVPSRVMQSSSNELSTSVSDSVKYE